MISSVVPDQVVAVETDRDDPAPLLPEEFAVVAHAVKKRRTEFATVRRCARQAMASLGVPADQVARAILPGPGGAPQWPPSIVGSMTHCEGYRAAAVARASEVVSIGIDAEPHAPLPEGVLPMISLPSERAMVFELADLNTAVCWDRLLFCIKECVYKTWYPCTHLWLDFDQAEVLIKPNDGTFGVKLLASGLRAKGVDASELTGRWAASDKMIMAGIVLGEVG